MNELAGYNRWMVELAVALVEVFVTAVLLGLQLIGLVLHLVASLFEVILCWVGEKRKKSTPDKPVQ